MQDFEKLGVFYLGKMRGEAAGEDSLLLYESRDLVTHAVCVGMTGSGKTGLCIGLLEEAAIDGVPAIAIDLKGDIANLLLQFPRLQPEDFLPWVEPAEAQRRGVSVQELAAGEAKLWREGLAKWGQTPERIQRLRESADFSVYTPGSSAGLPLSLLKSFAPPSAAVMDDREALRDRVSATATAVLSLLGIQAEPMKSREHILLSNIFDRTWQEGRSLSIGDLIHAIQDPPMQRVGVMDLETFYPAKQRFELSMALNNLLASPGFDLWLEGEPIDIGRLLHTAEGRPRMSIISIAHLSETERMFFVTLLLNELLSWTRSQSGTSSLRALFYMDEIFGYFPPVANPPSKKPLLTLLKQARAFGVGLVLATQNPVDLDYKGLANTGTWFIGRLQTDRDKQRLLDGLEGAMSESGGGFDRAEMERTLAGLGKRVFLMHNIHEAAPVVFESRWALSYLRGPMTRSQIRAVMEERGGRKSGMAVPVAAPTGSRPPALPPGIRQMFVPVRGGSRNLMYWPMVLGVAQIRFSDSKAGIDETGEHVFLTPLADDAVPVEWDECREIAVDPNDLEENVPDGATFAELPPAASNPKSYAAWAKDLAAWIYAHRTLPVYSSPSTKLTSAHGESEGDFRVRVMQAQRELRDAAIAKLEEKHAPKLAALQEKIRRAEQVIEREKEEARSRTLSAVADVGAGILGALFGRRKLTTAAKTGLRGATRSWNASSDVDRAEENRDALLQQLEALKAQLTGDVEALRARYDTAEEEFGMLAVRPKKSDIRVRMVTLAWAPFYAGGSAAWE